MSIETMQLFFGGNPVSFEISNGRLRQASDSALKKAARIREQRKMVERRTVSDYVNYLSRYFTLEL